MLKCSTTLKLPLCVFFLLPALWLKKAEAMHAMLIPQGCRCYTEHGNAGWEPHYLIMGWGRVQRRRSGELQHAPRLGCQEDVTLFKSWRRSLRDWFSVRQHTYLLLCKCSINLGCATSFFPKLLDCGFSGRELSDRWCSVHIIYQDTVTLRDVLQPLTYRSHLNRLTFVKLLFECFICSPYTCLLQWFPTFLWTSFEKMPVEAWEPILDGCENYKKFKYQISKQSCSSDVTQQEVHPDESFLLMPYFTERHISKQ